MSPLQIARQAHRETATQDLSRQLDAFVLNERLQKAAPALLAAKNMNTTQSQNSTATAAGHTPTRPELTFDGIGINGPDQYRTRVATFNGDANAQKYGPIFSQAPAMLEALKAIEALSPQVMSNEVRRAFESGANKEMEKWRVHVCQLLNEAKDKARAILAAVEGSAR